MKEIGKLLELLNEYDSGWDYDDYWGIYQYGMDRDAYIYHKYYALSKSYGFIKWLVDNDKIKPLRKFIGWETDEDEPYIQFDLIDQYIAYLSIQDEPIRFLCEILK